MRALLELQRGRTSGLTDGGGKVQAAITELDQKLEETSGILQLLSCFEAWCAELQPSERPPPAVGVGEAAAGGMTVAEVPAKEVAAELTRHHSRWGQQQEYEGQVRAQGELAPERSLRLQPSPVSERAAAGVLAATVVRSCGCALEHARLGQFAGAVLPLPPSSLAAPLNGMPPAVVQPVPPSSTLLSPPVPSPSPAPRQRLESYVQGLTCGYLAGEVAYLDGACRLASSLCEVRRRRWLRLPSPLGPTALTPHRSIACGRSTATRLHSPSSTMRSSSF